MEQRWTLVAFGIAVLACSVAGTSDCVTLLPSGFSPSYSSCTNAASKAATDSQYCTSCANLATSDLKAACYACVIEGAMKFGSNAWQVVDKCNTIPAGAPQNTLATIDAFCRCTANLASTTDVSNCGGYCSDCNGAGSLDNVQRCACCVVRYSTTNPFDTNNASKCKQNSGITDQPTTCQLDASCTGTQKSCSGRCVDLTSDASNCGMCGKVCSAGQTCMGGTCQPTTSGCTSNAQCSNGQVCIGGSCSCPSGYNKINNACIPMCRPSSVQSGCAVKIGNCPVGVNPSISFRPVHCDTTTEGFGAPIISEFNTPAPLQTCTSSSQCPSGRVCSVCSSDGTQPGPFCGLVATDSNCPGYDSTLNVGDLGVNLG